MTLQLILSFVAALLGSFLGTALYIGWLFAEEDTVSTPPGTLHYPAPTRGP